MSEDCVKRQIILGAGASDGYPLGSELLELIVFSGTDGCFPVEAKPKQEREFYEKLSFIARDIKICRPPSIDSYAMRLVGDSCDVIKSLIIAIIESHESVKRDVEQGNIDIWYGNLIPLLFPEGLVLSPVNERLKLIENNFKENSLKIITFNYDISLEQYIHRFLKTNIFSAKEDEEFLKKAKELIFEKIHHVYGSISNDPIEDSILYDRGYVEIYNNKLHYDAHGEGKAGMGKKFGFKHRDLLFYKNTNDDRWSFKVLKRAYEIYKKKTHESIELIRSKQESVKVSQCQYLYVLGFGFDSMNLDNIGLDYQNGPRIWESKCFVTNYGEFERINRLATDHLFRRGMEKYFIISKFNIKNSLSRSFYLTEEGGFKFPSLKVSF